MYSGCNRTQLIEPGSSEELSVVHESPLVEAGVVTSARSNILEIVLCFLLTSWRAFARLFSTFESAACLPLEERCGVAGVVGLERPIPAAGTGLPLSFLPGWYDSYLIEVYPERTGYMSPSSFVCASTSGSAIWDGSRVRWSLPSNIAKASSLRTMSLGVSLVVPEMPLMLSLRPFMDDVPGNARTGICGPCVNPSVSGVPRGLSSTEETAAASS